MIPINCIGLNSSCPVTIQITPITRPTSSLLFPVSSMSNFYKTPRILGHNRKLPVTEPHFVEPLFNPSQSPRRIPPAPLKDNGNGSRKGPVWHEDDRRVLVLCGFGCWVQGFRCFPWLALNYFMAQGLELHPSTLQLVQNSANLPMVAKPLYGIISDVVYLGDAHRLPYISLGVLLQAVSWGSLALMPVSVNMLPVLMAFILLSNLGASFAEVASDAFVAEFSKKQRLGELQSYAFMALAAGGILGNLSGGLFLQRVEQPKRMFLIFAILLSFQLAVSLTTKENTSDPRGCLDHHPVHSSTSQKLRKQFSDLMTVISQERIFYPLSWIFASIAVVPMLSGSIFFYQTQYLKINPSIIGMSKVIGQLMVLASTIFYNRYLKKIPLRNLICSVQIIYAFSILSDFFLVKQFNVKLGISNEVYVLCLSALAEAVAQFKVLPFSVLFANLCPRGFEGSVVAFSASALCLSSICSGFLGIALASLIGISSEDYSRLPLGILLQFLTALLPLGWISYLPFSNKVRNNRKRNYRRNVMLRLLNAEERQSGSIKEAM